MDLEISGELAGYQSGKKYYLTREDLLRLPQVDFTVTDDPNFNGAKQVKGVELEVLAREFAVQREQALIVAVCDDWYRGYYPRRYRELHQPVLALELNGRPPDGWPKNEDGASMGPYLVTHRRFIPSGRILSQQEEAQIPWGVVRLEFRNEKAALAPVIPQGKGAADAAVQSGYEVARQNCLRCHGPKKDEALKGKLTWQGIALFASQSPKNFAAYIRNPKALAPDAQMPGNPDYDDATLEALAAYFRNFGSKATR